MPGCRSAIFLDVHHIALRSEGGAHDADNLVTICGAHHRTLHEGRLTITGTVRAGLQFHHADGAAYGGEVSARRAALMTDVFLGLRALGFGDRESRRAVEATRRQVGEAEGFGDAMKLALRVLRAEAGATVRP